MRTYTPKQGEITRAWHIIDATDVVLGRLRQPDRDPAARRSKPTFAPTSTVATSSSSSTPRRWPSRAPRLAQKRRPTTTRVTRAA